MTTTDSLRGTRRSTNNGALLRLERINKNLLSLKTKLGSYMCEPKTLTLYQRMESLKFQLEDMLKHNQDLIKKLYGKGSIKDESSSVAQQQFQSYKELELKILEYIGMAKMHC